MSANHHPQLGTVVTYVSDTRFGPVFLPAEVISHEAHAVRLRIYTDRSGGSEWVTSAEHDPNKAPGTWHHRESIAS